MIGDQFYGPYITFSCSTCGQKGHMRGPNAHKTQLFRHCGIAEAAPADVANRFADLRKHYDSLKKEKRAPRMELGTPVNALAEKRTADLRRQRLIDEAKEAARKAKPLFVSA